MSLSSSLLRWWRWGGGSREGGQPPPPAALPSCLALAEVDAACHVTLQKEGKGRGRGRACGAGGKPTAWPWRPWPCCQRRHNAPPSCCPRPTPVSPSLPHPPIPRPCTNSCTPPHLHKVAGANVQQHALHALQLARHIERLGERQQQRLACGAVQARCDARSLGATVRGL